MEEPELPPNSASPEPARETPPIAALPPPQQESAHAQPAYADRSTGLIVFGVFQIILGLLAALMIPLVALGALFSRLAPGGAMRPAQILSAAATYATISAVLIVLGIGSIRSRRWARALTLITAWYWLIMGALTTVLLTAMLPVAMRTALQGQNAAGAPSPEVSAGVMAVILTVIITLMAFFLIVVPLAFVVFYSRRDVAATCRDRDPIPRWTDRAPLPVLGASVVYLGGALYLLVTGLTTPMFPFFGRYLTGISGMLCFLAVAGLDLYLAAALFRLKSLGWWIAITTLPLRLTSMTLTFLRADIFEAYSRAGFSDTQLRMLSTNPMFRGHVMLWWSLFSMVLFFGYLLWIRRYFNTAPQPAAVPIQAG
ncbi:MAG TPA: hypothetical protein VMG31_08925 [Verrucomicrobiae bacterium]|nr:hypothetical protein [Verrucomicrobiae bacterium]